ALASSQTRTGMVRAEKTRQCILDAAGPLFADKGFKATTISQICKAASVNQAAVSFHFGGKEQLYVALVRHAYEFALSEVPMPQWAPNTPAKLKLRDFVLTFLRRAVAEREPRWPCQLIMRELIEPTEACEEFVRGFVRPNFETLQSILTELLPTNFPQARMRLIGFSIVGQCLHYRVARHVIRLVAPDIGQFDEERLQRLADHITQFSLAALGMADPITA
ncbi:MAG TPA: CerR family C-terminal domain-containing protein, partial [Gemmataceae bacterium]|nr:CerR family C-terminal domain-containing protein [Gemmataceae bacterium]